MENKTIFLNEKDYLKSLKLQYRFTNYKIVTYTKAYFLKYYDKLKYKIIDFNYNNFYNKYIVILSKY